MAELYWSYWDTSLRFGVLALVLLATTPILKRWIGPKWLCWAWAALILRLAFPLAFPYSGSIFNLSENLQPSTWTGAIRSGVVEAGWGETVIPNSRDQDDFVRDTVIGFSWETALVLLWLSGLFALSIRLGVNVVRLRRFFNKATQHNSGRLYEIFKDVRRRYGVNANVPLLVSDEVNTPGIAGIFNPRVVIPKTCAENLSDEELHCVFLHELTHYRRGDLLLHHVLLLVCYVHWYNPLVWLVMRQFKLTMEQACDADVMGSDCVDTAQTYGLTLIHVMQRTRAVGGSPAGALCLLGNRKSGALKERIHLIASPRGGNPVFATLGILVFSFCFVFAITGEEIVEEEAERLISLTRFSGPALFVSPVPGEISFDLDPTNFVLETASLGSPQSWVQDMDVSEYKGHLIVARVRYRMSGESASQRFWLNVKNEKGQIIATEESTDERLVGRNLREIEIPIRLSIGAKEIVYGLSTSGAATLWVESIEVVK